MKVTVAVPLWLTSGVAGLAVPWPPVTVAVTSKVSMEKITTTVWFIVDSGNDVGVGDGHGDPVIDYGRYVITGVRRDVYGGIGAVIDSLGGRQDCAVSAGDGRIDNEGVDGEGDHHGVIDLYVVDDVSGGRRGLPPGCRCR